MALINRVPPGLLSLLDIKALGQNPSELSGVVAPTLDMLDFYLRSYSSLVTDFTAVINAIGFFPVTAFDTQPGEIVVLSGLGVIADSTLAAGTSVSWCPVIADGALGRIIAKIGEPASGTAGQQLTSGTNEIIILPPQTRIGVMVNTVTLGTAPRARFSARVLRLLI
jgi:hypothetical protein